MIFLSGKYFEFFPHAHIKKERENKMPVCLSLDFMMGGCLKSCWKESWKPEFNYCGYHQNHSNAGLREVQNPLGRHIKHAQFLRIKADQTCGELQTHVWKLAPVLSNSMIKCNRTDDLNPKANDDHFVTQRILHCIC